MSPQPTSKSNPGGVILAVIVGSLGAAVVAGSFQNHAEMNRWLSRQREQTVTIDPTYVDPKNEGRLVLVIGSVSSRPLEHYDPAFDVRGRGLAMVRQTMEFGYAGGDGGGGDGWYPRREPSVLGDSPEAGKDRFRTAVWVPSTVHLGAFTLDESLVRSYLRQKYPHTRSDATAEPVSQRTASDDIRLQLEMAAATVATYRELRFAKSPSGTPNYGDKRVQYRVFRTDAEPVTLLCRQSGDRLGPERRDRGTPFFQLVLGQADRDEIFAGAYQVARRDSLLSGGFGMVLILTTMGIFVRRWCETRSSADR